MVVTTRAFDRPRPGPIGHEPTEENCRLVRTLRPPSHPDFNSYCNRPRTRPGLWRNGRPVFSSVHDSCRHQRRE
jgi:hypothetical protein